MSDDIKNPQPMDESEIRTFIGRKIHTGLNDEDGDLSETREQALKRYQGDLYGTEREGYSKFTTREAFETVEWVMPSLLRVFASGDKVVVFDPVGPEDEAAADQETDVVNYKIMKANDGDGFLALHNWFKDVLMYPNGYIKVYVEETKRVETEEYTEVLPAELADIEEDEDFEIVSQDSHMATIEVPNQMGDMEEYELEVFDIEVRHTIKERKLRVESVPPEQVIIDNDCFSPNLDFGNSDFTCHRVQKSFTQLVKEGFDRNKLEEVGSIEDYTWNDETVSRLFYEDEDPDAQDDDDVSMRQFWVHECYCNLDVDGDGLGEFRKIVMVGGEIFENEETSYQPIVAQSAIIMTHKHTGMSYIDVVQDLQELKTTLTRQLLDNLYKINVRRKAINERAMLPDGSTMDAMLNVQSEWIPVLGDPNMAIAPEIQQSVIGDLLPVIQYTDERQTMRTGVSPNNALDPNVLQESTMGAFMAGMEKASERVEMLTRVIAETGMKRLSRKVHQLSRMYPDIAKTVKLRGEWVTVNPTDWRERLDMSANVGLGFNNKQQVIQMAVQLLQIQREAMGAGLADREEIFNTFKKLINASSFGEVTEYFIKPGSERDQVLMEQKAQEAENAPLDPAMIVAQAQSRAAAMDAETKRLKAKADADLAMKKQEDETAIKMRELEQADEKLAYDKYCKEFEREQWRAENSRAQKESKAKVRKDNAQTLKTLQEGEAVNPGEQVPENV